MKVREDVEDVEDNTANNCMVRSDRQHTPYNNLPPSPPPYDNGNWVLSKCTSEEGIIDPRWWPGHFSDRQVAWPRVPECKKEFGHLYVFVLNIYVMES